MSVLEIPLIVLTIHRKVPPPVLLVVVKRSVQSDKIA